MFKLTDINIKDIFSIEYHFEDDNLDIEIQLPLEIEVTDNGDHIITDNEGIFIISPKWIYISIIKHLNKEIKDTL